MTVGPALQVGGHENVFAIGDVSTADAKMAGMAGMQAALVAENIIKLVNGDHDLAAYEPYGAAIVVPDRTRRRQRPTPRPRRPHLAGDGRDVEGPRPDGRPLRGALRHRDPRLHIIHKELISMPAITVDNTLVLPRIARPDPATSTPRPVAKVITAHRQLEGAGISIRRPFPGDLSLTEADPFLLLDQAGPHVNGPEEAKGAPWHPHRGFETVSYILDGEIAHHDSNGGGGVIAEGDTQWMTAGAGILHDELPTERMYRAGGVFHAVQLWVNLPPALKMTTPRYQSITSDALRLLTSDDGGALIRLIAGDIAGYTGPGVTHTPITYAHATLAPGAQISVPWNPAFNALAYVLTGHGTAGAEGRPIEDGQLVVFGPGDNIIVAAAERQAEPLDVLLLGGLPIRAPIAHYGPFVMNTREEILQAIDDYQAGRLGTVPADQLAPRNFA